MAVDIPMHIVSCPHNVAVPMHRGRVSEGQVRRVRHFDHEYRELRVARCTVKLSVGVSSPWGQGAGPIVPHCAGSWDEPSRPLAVKLPPTTLCAFSARMRCRHVLIRRALLGATGGQPILPRGAGEPVREDPLSAAHICGAGWSPQAERRQTLISSRGTRPSGCPSSNLHVPRVSARAPLATCLEPLAVLAPAAVRRRGEVRGGDRSDPRMGERRTRAPACRGGELTARPAAAAR